jgi:hypothetical protein
MNPRRTPQRVGLRQSLNQPANLALDRRPPNSSRFTGQTSPVPAKTLPLPAHHRVGMDDEQSLPPVLPHHRDRHPEPAVSPDQPWTLLLALVDGELLTQCKIFQDNVTMTFSEQPNQAKQIQKEGEHVARFFLLAH